MTNKQLIALARELRGFKCRCGKVKASHQTFCSRCYHRLAPSLRTALYRDVGEGYEEAYDAACSVLFPSPAVPGGDE
jgi:hypothetical protein